MISFTDVSGEDLEDLEPRCWIAFMPGAVPELPGCCVVSAIQEDETVRERIVGLRQCALNLAPLVGIALVATVATGEGGARAFAWSSLHGTALCVSVWRQEKNVRPHYA